MNVLIVAAEIAIEKTEKFLAEGDSEAPTPLAEAKVSTGCGTQKEDLGGPQLEGRQGDVGRQVARDVMDSEEAQPPVLDIRRDRWRNHIADLEEKRTKLQTDLLKTAHNVKIFSDQARQQEKKLKDEMQRLAQANKEFEDQRSQIRDLDQELTSLKKQLEPMSEATAAEVAQTGAKENLAAAKAASKKKRAKKKRL